jgi:Mn-dependent DtxR family transcriptional regulator
MTLSPDNFFKIEGWMRTELNLKGNELMAYALIYSFQTAYDKPFDGSQAYIAEWLGMSRSHTNVILTKMRDKGLINIVNSDKGYIHKCFYSCIENGERFKANTIRNSNSGVLENLTAECQKIEQRSVRKSNNIETDIETDILNRLLKERGDATEVAPSLAPSNSVENSEPKAKPKQKRFKKPTAEEINDYCESKGISLDVDYFMNYYESNGWMVGRNHMKDWRATVQNWAKREKQYNWKGKNNASSTGNTTSTTSDYISEYDYEPDEIIYT